MYWFFFGIISTLIHSFDSEPIFPQESCLLHLLPHLKTNWDQYVLYFFRPALIDSVHNRFDPDSSIHSRILTLRDCAICNDIILTRGNYRYSDTFNVVITAIKFSAWRNKEFDVMKMPVDNFNRILVPSRTLLLYIWSNTNSFYYNYRDIARKTAFYTIWDTNISNFPALKAIITLPRDFSCRKSETTVSIICSEYCSSTPQRIYDFDINLEKFGIYNFHRKLFWDAEGKIIPTLIVDDLKSLRKSRRGDSTSCRSTRDRISYKCSRDSLAALNLATLHNITIRLHDSTPENKERFSAIYFNLGIEQISATTRFTEYCICTVPQLHFNRFSAQSIIYCPVSKEFIRPPIKFSTWHEPFSLEIWAGILCIIIFAILNSLRHHSSVRNILVDLEGYIASISGADVQIRKFIIICSFVFILTQLYVNGLTSIITVTTPIKGIRFIKEFIKNGYKILFRQARASVSLEDLLYEEFQSIGVTLDEAFHVTHKKYTDNEMIRWFLAPSKRFGFIFSSSLATYKAAHSAMLLNHQFNVSFTCFSLEQMFHKHLYLWHIRTENQQWISISLERMATSGLFYKWDEWSTWHRMLVEKLHTNDVPTSSDLINISKVLALLLIFCFLTCISVLVFIIECNSTLGIPRSLVLQCNWVSRCFGSILSKVTNFKAQTSACSSTNILQIKVSSAV
ncbi:unnamed protein product [Orchesella dallaii]|uniref:Uncharacterized protein n=1 Tax=Orchesella dallaii TaxID=48710 RepID=A0ABP1SAW1_9HEXA